ncbi:hypothetical protein EFY79_19280 [Hanamia caeni]|uniref:Uncharacterized protein n=1 Tax=Hanamia caeni TaxID=2294116 RepID=A0A3M9N7P0_9BACT|nr:hypothetical protein [Hanamia caeni]RNI33395.1 hypothetical protein EFY79_19280 [Hanamia caeni]
MADNPLLAQLAQISGEFIAANPSSTALTDFQNHIASALLQSQTLESLQDSHLFETMASYATEQLSAEELSRLSSVVKANAGGAVENDIRVFRREVPFASSQAKASVPEWARGAAITKSIGPLTKKDGRSVVFDIYKIIEGVKIFIQGSANPSIVLPVKVFSILKLNPQANNYGIPAGSVWINAALIAPGAPTNQFCGLKIKGGTIKFSSSVTLTSNSVTIPMGTVVTVDLNLDSATASGDAAGGIGLDAKNSKLTLPDSFSFSFSNSGFKITAAGNGSWSLYGQENSFTYAAGVANFYLAQFNRVLIPYNNSVADFKIVKCDSKVTNIKESAPIQKSAWSLSCALLDVNNPLEAAGAGALMALTKEGLQLSWNGLKDINLENTEWISLRNPWILCEPGRISITDTNAGNENAKQVYQLWKNKKGVWNKIELQYRKKFNLFYNCIRQGNETVMVQTDCTGTVDKPVDVAGIPFSLKSKQTIFMLTVSENAPMVLLYDDNLWVDNFTGQNDTLKPKAIGLNNALLTVTPIASFFLYGKLKAAPDWNEFEKTALLFSYGLLSYLPTLPDPYAADVDIFKRRYSVFSNYDGLGAAGTATNIKQLLVALLQWQNAEEPSVNFIWGDIAAGLQKAVTPFNTATSAEPAGKNVPPKVNVAIAATKIPQTTTASISALANPVSLNLNKNAGYADERASLATKRQTDFLTSQYISAGVPDSEATKMAISNVQSSAERMTNLQQRALFNLLDVSTNADLLGVSIGFVNEEFIFRETFKVEPITENQNPLSIQGMDVVASGRFVRIFTVPQISWEPLINIPTPDATNPPTPFDPPLGILRFDDDGFPALIGNTGKEPVAVGPIPATKELVEKYKSDNNYKAWSLFTLPNGMAAIGRYNQSNFYLPKPNNDGAKIELVKASFNNGTSAGWQIVTRSGANPNEDNSVFEGMTFQQTNVHNILVAGTWSILGSSPTTIFNNEFANQMRYRGVPLERYDFTGYGAQVFSQWLNKNAEIAQVSQSIFDVWRGRVAKEIIQVRSIIYPWGIRVVRTITMYRSSTGFEYRIDSGWRADSDGVYNFLTLNEPNVGYDFHPGLVKGVYDVSNIVENDLAPYKTTWLKDYGVYVDEASGLAVNVPAGGKSLEIEMIPVYFDADVKITDVEGTKIVDGVPEGRMVPSKKMVGYLQLAPRGVIISSQHFANVLDLQNGLGGPVDCEVNINGSGQKMRISRVEVNHSLDASNKIVFATAAKGMPVLPKDGSWSLVMHDKNSKEVVPVSESAVDLTRQGLLKWEEKNVNGVTAWVSSVPDQSHAKEITAISELFESAEDRLKQYAFLQSTDAQKVLFRNPFFQKAEKLLHSTMPDLGDAYRLLNSKGIFPNLDGLPKIDLDAKGCATKIIEQGYQLVDKAATNVLKALEQSFPQDASFTFIDKPGILKVYVEYAAKGKDKNAPPSSQGILNFDINSEVNNWVNKMNDVTMVVDLLTMERLFLIQGKFDTAKGEKPEFKGPKLIPGEDLKPIIEILEVLEAIGTSNDYADLIKKGLKIAMSNSPNNWEYKFTADKEIPVLRFPAAYLDGPTTPLRLEAGLKLGVYFNMGMELPPASALPELSAGAFIEFDGKLSVMCVSLAAATVYAVGQVTLRISADTIKGPGLYMKMGFGIELMVGIPVVGNVSVYYAVGIEISLDTSQITVAAFILFRGRAELIGGLVTIQIQIEAAGKIHKEIGSGRTDCIAQVTFSIDVSIVFVINIHETESWQEARQIA